MKIHTLRIGGLFASALFTLGLLSCLGTGPVAPPVTVTVYVPVSDSNPSFQGLHDTTLDEGRPLSFALSATDPKNDTVLFSMLGPVGSILTGNVFTWTPDQSQSGIHIVRFMAQAKSQPERRDTAHIVITVRDNPRPVFKISRDTVIDEGEPLSLTLFATDPVGGGITYSLLGPEGSALNGAHFTWMPNYGQSGQYVLRFIASDIASQKDTLFVAVRVRDFPISSLPEFTQRRDTTVLSGRPLSMTLFATDPSSTGITYTLLGPAGASVAGNVFTWTPTQAQSGQSLVRFIATDHRVPPRSDTIYLVLTVEVNNLPPVLQALHDTSISENQSFQLTLQATDPENDPFTYSMQNPPSGSSLSGNVFSWKPDTTQAGIYALTFVVSQNGSPTLKDTVAMSLTVTNFTGNGSTGYSADSSIVAYWDFNEGSGTALNDKTSGGRNCTVTGATWVAGIAGTALSFNGAQYAQSTSALPDMTEQTISAWVYLNAIQASSFFFEANTDPGRDNRLGMTATGHLRYGTRDVGTDIHDGKAVLTTGRWYFLAGTATPTTVKLYIDGALDSTFTGAAVNLSGSHYRINIGRTNDGGSHVEEYAKGIIDEVKVYNKALTQVQIQQEYFRNVQVVTKTQASGSPP